MSWARSGPAPAIWPRRRSPIPKCGARSWSIATTSWTRRSPRAPVIEGASRISVTLLDGRELEADLLGSDRDADLAVLKVKATNLPAVPLGRSSDLMIGETVLAIGNPFGLSNTVTTGVLSAVGRTVPSERGERHRLRHSVGPRPPGGGGPAALRRAATPVDGGPAAQRRSGAGPPLRALGAARGERTLKVKLRGARPPQGLGLEVLERTIGLTIEEVRGGLAVRRVAADSPAAQRRLRPGDVILGANGQRTDSKDALGREILRGLDRGGVLLSVRRGRYVYTLDFAL